MKEKLIWCGLAAVLIASACGRGPTLEEKRARLEFTRRGYIANLMRSQAECRALAVEFPDNPRMHEDCVKAYRIEVEIAEKLIDDIDKREAELERTGR